MLFRPWKVIIIIISSSSSSSNSNSNSISSGCGGGDSSSSIVDLSNIPGKHGIKEIQKTIMFGTEHILRESTNVNVQDIHNRK
jgi:hypothetical protein